MYTDGCCYRDTTTGTLKAELKAVVKALTMGKGKIVNIYTDSAYVYGLCHHELSKLQHTSWKTTAGSDVKHSICSLSKGNNRLLPDPTGDVGSPGSHDSVARIVGPHKSIQEKVGQPSLDRSTSDHRPHLTHSESAGTNRLVPPEPLCGHQRPPPGDVPVTDHSTPTEGAPVPQASTQTLGHTETDTAWCASNLSGQHHTPSHTLIKILSAGPVRRRRSLFVFVFYFDFLFYYSF